MNDWNKQVIEEFRANGGKVAQFGDAPLVILHTIGAKSGQLREIPLVTGQDDDGFHIFASKAGAPTNPDWYHNLKATPEITVEQGSESYQARLDELDAETAARKLEAMAAVMPQFGEYVEQAKPRVIPAFSITRL
ncbi:MAG: nitroreductase/quinone reductase family protein [Acidimicrobiales bacterium]